MRHKRRHGFILIMAVALIPLFGLAVLLTTAQTAQLSRRLKHTEKQAEQKNQRLSAEALKLRRTTVSREGAYSEPPPQSATVPAD